MGSIVAVAVIGLVVVAFGGYHYSAKFRQIDRLAVRTITPPEVLRCLERIPVENAYAAYLARRLRDRYSGVSAGVRQTLHDGRTLNSTVVALLGFMEKLEWDDRAPIGQFLIDEGAASVALGYAQTDATLAWFIRKSDDPLADVVSSLKSGDGERIRVLLGLLREEVTRTSPKDPQGRLVDEAAYRAEVSRQLQSVVDVRSDPQILAEWLANARSVDALALVLRRFRGRMFELGDLGLIYKRVDSVVSNEVIVEAVQREPEFVPSLIDALEQDAARGPDEPILQLVERIVFCCPASVQPVRAHTLELCRRWAMQGATLRFLPMISAIGSVQPA